MVDNRVRSRVSRWPVVVSTVLVIGLSSAIAGAQGIVAASDRSANLSVRVTVDVNNEPVRSVVKSIAMQAGLNASYDPAKIPAGARVTLRLVNVPVNNAFQQVLRGTGLVAEIMASGNVLIVSDSSVVHSGIITGKVTSGKTKAPVAGATVLLDDAPQGVVTDASGTFRISTGAGEHTLTVRAVGFVRQTKKVIVRDGVATELELLLETSASVLDEVVVTGSVVATERREITTPITVVTAEDIERRGITKVEDLFRGSVPSVYARDAGVDRWVGDSLGRMESSVIYSRGASTLSGGGAPLKTFIDGVEMQDPSQLGFIDAKSIERIEIVTGPQAATMYGSGAIGGVMQIFTKKGGGSKRDEIILNIGYGLLESNISPARAPAHSDRLSVTGGRVGFNYTGSAKYDYLGQWQPGLFSRSIGLSGGATLSGGPAVFSLTASTIVNSNGTAIGRGFRRAEEQAKGLLRVSQGDERLGMGSRKNAGSSLLLGFSFDIRVRSFWAHHVAVGLNQTEQRLEPRRPQHRYLADTLWEVQQGYGKTLSGSYNTTLSGHVMPGLAASLTLGGSGSQQNRTRLILKAADPAYNRWVQPSISYSFPDGALGGFVSGRLGLIDRLFLDFAVRGEKNQAYGDEYGLNWTPKYGASFVLEYRDLTIKLMTSYGRATRPPRKELRLPLGGTLDFFEPSYYIDQLANPTLGAEYSRGPQGGIELFLGRSLSLTVNTYRETVDGLIQEMAGDSIPYKDRESGEIYYGKPRIYVNAGRMKRVGWEATARFALGPLGLSGTYSWNDSRVAQVAANPLAGEGNIRTCDLRQNCMITPVNLNGTFDGISSHFGSIQLDYSHRGTSVNVDLDWTGAWTVRSSPPLLSFPGSGARITTYNSSVLGSLAGYVERPYTRAHFNAIQRISADVSASLRVSNLTNSIRNDGVVPSPSLGRRTDLGLSLRLWP